MEMSDHCRFTPGMWALGTHLIGGWVGPRSGLEAVAKKIPTLPPLGIEHRSSSLQPSLYNDWATAAQKLRYATENWREEPLLFHLFTNSYPFTEKCVHGTDSFLKLRQFFSCSYKTRKIYYPGLLTSLETDTKTATIILFGCFSLRKLVWK
jgi:hypothetical protein